MAGKHVAENTLRNIGKDAAALNAAAITVIRMPRVKAIVVWGRQARRGAHARMSVRFMQDLRDGYDALG